VTEFLHEGNIVIKMKGGNEEGNIYLSGGKRRNRNAKMQA